jgi:hypothetical protein
MFGALLDLCKTVFDHLKSENELRLETRLRVSGILEEISDILRDTANKIKADDYPHYNCVLLENLSDKLHFNLIEHVNVEELDRLHKLLRESSQVEKLYNLRKDPEVVKELEKTSAEFKSFALSIKF